MAHETYNLHGWSNGGDLGRVLNCQSATFASAHGGSDPDEIAVQAAILHAGNSYAGSLYRIDRACMQFDTGDLAALGVEAGDILEATLHTWCALLEKADGDYDVVLVSGDFADPPAKDNYGGLLDDTNSGGSQNTADIAESAIVDLALTEFGRGLIALAGITRLAMRISTDIDCLAPTGWNRIYLDKLYESTGFRPQLLIRCRSIPEVITAAVEGVHATFATLNGFLADDGELETAVGFEYGLTNAYGAETIPAVQGEGAFSAAVSGLEPLTAYHFRARAANSKGTVYGIDLTFTTGKRKGTLWMDPGDNLRYIDDQEDQRKLAASSVEGAYGVSPGSLKIKGTYLLYRGAAGGLFGFWDGYEGTPEAAEMAGNLRIKGTRLYYKDADGDARYLEGEELS